MQANDNKVMREALVKIYHEIRAYCVDYGAGESHESLVDRTVDDPPDYTCYRDSILEIDRIMEAALAKPPRNCDRFNTGNPMKDAEDAYDAWQRYCDDPTIPPSCKVESAFRQWLFATAKPETEGKGDGSK